MMRTCIDPEILSLSLRISWRFFVPKIFLNVVCASNLCGVIKLWHEHLLVFHLVEWCAFSTFATLTVAFETLIMMYINEMRRQWNSWDPEFIIKFRSGTSKLILNWLSQSLFENTYCSEMIGYQCPFPLHQQFSKFHFAEKIGNLNISSRTFTQDIPRGKFKVKIKVKKR